MTNKSTPASQPSPDTVCLSCGKGVPEIDSCEDGRFCNITEVPSPAPTHFRGWNGKWQEIGQGDDAETLRAQGYELSAQPSPAPEEYKHQANAGPVPGDYPMDRFIAALPLPQYPASVQPSPARSDMLEAERDRAIAESLHRAQQRGLTRVIDRLKNEPAWFHTAPVIELVAIANLLGNFVNDTSAESAPSGETIDRLLRAGRGLHEHARILGWPDDGEGAFEFVQRAAYELGAEDARRATAGTGDFRERFKEAYSALSAAALASPFWNQSMEELLAAVQSEIERRATAGTTATAAPGDQWTVGNLLTMSDSDYPGMGGMFAQVWQGDDLIARVYGDTADEVRSRAAKVASNAGAAPAIPEGWRLVPIEPTEQMLLATRGGKMSEPSWHSYARKRHATIYRAMLAAAPSNNSPVGAPQEKS